MKILVVEDDTRIARLICYNLEKAGYVCHCEATGEDALCYMDSGSADLVLLDIMLPKMDGLEVCRAMKQDKHLAAIPVIMLTAKGEEVDRIVGFELGADDYVVKPFSPRELVLRVKAVLKRRGGLSTKQDILEVGNLKLDVDRCRVLVKNKEVKVTAMELKLLTVLMNKKGRVQSRECLLEEVWNMSQEVTTRTVDTHVKRLRQKLGEAGRLIETVRGYGYRIHEEDACD